MTLTVRDFLLVFFLFLPLAGCNSSSSDDSSTNVDVSGFYTGISSDEFGTRTFEVLAYDGELKAFSLEGGLLYDGSYWVSGEDVTTDVVGWEIGGTRPFARFEGSGTASGGNEINLTFSPISGDGGTGSLSVERVPESSINLTNEAIAGVYSYTVEGVLFELVINVDGSFQGGDSLGCAFRGQMTIPERDLNILQVESEDISGVCFGDREMSGLAVMTTNLTDQVGLDGIVFVVSGATSIFLDVIPRTTDVGNFDMD